jgi:hypothetical protein
MLIWAVGLVVVGSVLVWVVRKPKTRPPPETLNLYHLNRRKP